VTVGLIWTFLVVDPLIVLSTIICGTIAAISSPETQSKMARLWGQSILKFARVHLEVEGLEYIKPGRGYVFVSNHLSYMDTPAILSSIPVDFRFLAKEELFKIPFMGDHLKRAGHIAVPLDDPRGSVRTLSAAAKTIQSLGISLLVFPEGGRSETGELQEFKDGAAYLAIKAQAPIVPLAVIGTHKVLPMHGKKITSGTVRLVIGEPIETAGMITRDRTTLTATLRDHVVKMIGEPVTVKESSPY
jgi:1-acyl-sn-glycerol-3-phosphate acyltransferase